MTLKHFFEDLVENIKDRIPFELKALFQALLRLSKQQKNE